MDNTAANAPSLVLYDIQLDPAYPPSAPNPWKARYALNYTRTAYRTQWVPFLQVGPTRRALGVPSVRKHPDGGDFPTLPVLRDTVSGACVGDSFDIALYAHNHSNHSAHTETAAAPLFPPHTVALHRAFNAHVDALFSFKGGALLAGYYQHFDPRTEAQDKAEFVRRIPTISRWEDLEMPLGSEVREKAIEGFKEALGNELAVWFVNRDKGPFIEGDTPRYADFIIGGWLQFMKVNMPEWDRMREWHDGLWGKLSDALEQWAQVQ